MYNHENREGHNSLLMQRSYCSQIKLLESFSQFFHKLLNLKDIMIMIMITTTITEMIMIMITYCYLLLLFPFLLYFVVLSGN